MKRSWLILVLLACFLAAATTAQATYWTKVSGGTGTMPLFPDGTFYRVQAIDENTFVTLGNKVEGMFDINFKQVWKSTDGGVTVNPVFDASTYASGLICKGLMIISDLHFFDANNGLLFGGWGGADCGGLLSTSHNYIVNTSDGGTSWAPLTMSPDPANVLLYGADFFDANNGFTGGLGDNLWNTTNGGGSWTQVASANDVYDDMEYHSISMASATDVYAAGEYYWEDPWADDWSGDYDDDWSDDDASDDDGGTKGFNNIDGDAGQLIYSNNSGLSWTTVLTTADLDAPYTDLVGFHKVQFIGDSGWVLAANSEERLVVLLYTTDAGTTWTPATLPDDAGDLFMVADFQMLNASVGWAVGYDYSDNGIILSTDDGGVNWTQDDYTGYGALLSIHMSDGRHGYAVGKRLAVVKYLNNTNTPPVADAGEDQTVAKGEIVDLDGSASYDPDGDSIQAYVWTQTDGPETVSLSGGDTATPSFTATTDGDFTFQLVVSDGMDDSNPDSVTITVGSGGDDDDDDDDDDDTTGGDDDTGWEDDDAADDDDDDDGGCCG